MNLIHDGGVFLRSRTSRFRGVKWDGQVEKWAAYIRVDGKLKHLGFFVHEEDAALAYDEARRERIKEGGRRVQLNFPDYVPPEGYIERARLESYDQRPNEYIQIGNITALVITRKDGTRHISYIDNEYVEEVKKFTWFMRGNKPVAEVARRPKRQYVALDKMIENLQGVG